MEIKDLLYKEIHKLSIEDITFRITKNIYDSESIINQILQNSLPLLLNNGYTKHHLVYLSEALLHFLLTISTLPSSRKIVINDFEVSIVIPNSRYLITNKEDLLLVQFINSNIHEELVLKHLVDIQRSDKIWIVSYEPIRIPNQSINFVLNYSSNVSDPSNINLLPFSKILIEIDDYVKKIGYNGLKIL